MKFQDVSVVVPAYNAQGFIVDAMESIAWQSTAPREVIVIDDGSRDATAALVRDWAARRKPPFAVQVHQQSNGGISSARNHGLRHCTGAWVALLDADDIWEREHLELLFAGLKPVPSAVASYGAGKLFTGQQIHDVPYDEFWDNPSRKLGLPIEGTQFYSIDRRAFARLIRGNFIKPSSLMFRRDVVARMGGFCEVLGNAEDREFLARLLLRGSFVYCSTPITRYRWHDDNASQTKNARRNQGFGLQAIRLVLTRQRDELSTAETEACEQALREGSREYLSVCALDGLGQYIQGARFVRRLIGTVPTMRALTIGQFGRCVYHSVR